MLLKAHPPTLWLKFLGERTVSMLYLRQTCLSSIWYYCLCQLHTCIMLNEFILQVLWLFDTITINATLHGLRQMDSHLGTPMRITILMYLNLCEKVPIHHHLWDVPVAHTAQKWQCPLVETFYHPTLADLRAIFLVLDRIL